MPSIPEEPEVPESEVERFTMPDFVKPLYDLDVLEGKEAVLKCRVTGLPYPTITWFHNGKKMESTEDRKMTQCEWWAWFRDSVCGTGTLIEPYLYLLFGFVFFVWWQSGTFTVWSSARCATPTAASTRVWSLTRWARPPATLTCTSQVREHKPSDHQ